MKFKLLIISLLLAPIALAGEYQGQLSVNPYAKDAISPYTKLPSYGGPKLYNSDGEYRGRLNSNQYDSESVSNPYGKYGSRYSSESINNPYGAGSEYRQDSPNNPYGSGWSVYDD